MTQVLSRASSIISQAAKDSVTLVIELFVALFLHLSDACITYTYITYHRIKCLESDFIDRGKRIF